LLLAVALERPAVFELGKKWKAAKMGRSSLMLIEAHHPR
jgi:hypothetical protein